jgi:hypothetical protein
MTYLPFITGTLKSAQCSLFDSTLNDTKPRSGGVFYCLEKTMGIKVRGVKQSKSGLNRIINDVKGRKVVRALQSAMIIASSQAAIYTPIDTSTLLNSQYRELINNGVRLTGRVGYTANYAVFVHDPNVPQTFRRAAAEKAQEIINRMPWPDSKPWQCACTYPYRRGPPGLPTPVHVRLRRITPSPTHQAAIRRPFLFERYTCKAVLMILAS